MNTVHDKLEQIGIYSNQEQMSDAQRIKYLNTLMRSENIAEELDFDQLSEIIKQVKHDYDKDKSTMEDWLSAIDDGMELSKFDLQGKSTPWEQSANFKSPRSIAFGLAFGDRATTELLNGTKIAKSTIYGEDREGEKQKRGDRLALVLNWEIQRNMKGWKTNHRKMLYMLPNYGCIFKKQFYNHMTGKTESRMIGYDQFVVNNDETIDGDLKRFTEDFRYEPSEIIQRQASGVWADFETQIDTSVSNNDGCVSEQYTWIDIDGDGILEPYQVTFQTSGKHIYHIKALYSKDTISLAGKDKRQRLTLTEINQLNELAKDENNVSANLYSGYKVINFDAIHGITKYGYIPDPEGGYLDVGNYYLLSSLIKSVNKAVNQMLNSSELSLNGGGILSDDWDQESGDLRIGLQEWYKTAISAEKLSASMFPWQVKEPSQVHIALVELLISELQNLASSYDLSQVIGPNTPAASVLAMITQEESQHGAIIRGVYDSMSEEFTNIKLILMNSMPNAKYQNLVDDLEANIKEDLTDENLDVYPDADPESSSRMQRLQKAVVELDTAQLYIAAQKFDMIDPILRNFYKSIGSDLAEIIYPEKTPEQLAQEQQQAQAQQEQAAAQAEEERVTNKRLSDSVSVTNEEKALLDRAKADAQVKKTDIEVAKLSSEAELLLEKAETEAANQEKIIKETRTEVGIGDE